MGRSLGYFDSDELDRPELNKCPDCECYFASEECPLCGKICPEEFRAGNRAPVKKPKKRKNSSGRVQFIAWYHSWWFILIMFFVSRIAGLILFITSPYSKKAKIITAASVVGGYILLFALGSGLLMGLFEKPPVNEKISRAEYVERCDGMTVEEYYRDAYNEGNYVSLELVVEDRKVFGDGAYYICSDRNDRDRKIYVMDFSVDKQTNYLKGDMIRVYGECSGYADFKLEDQEELPLLYMAYSELIG